MSSLVGQRLSKVLGITNPADYKLHCARWNYHDQPLDVFVATPDEWVCWNNHSPEKNHFNRPFVITLADFYPEPDTWLFCGVYRVKDRKKHVNPHDPKKPHWFYEIDRDETGSEYAGKLKISFPYRKRPTRIKFDGRANELIVKGFIKRGYKGKEFSKAEDVTISYGLLLAQYQNAAHTTWRNGLSKLGGVYLITDTKENKRYVGSAYGGRGIWGRWEVYMTDPTGGNKGLRAHLSNMSRAEKVEYAKDHFQFSILESWTLGPKPTSEIIHREGYWKKMMLSSTNQFGFNHN
ncbi:MAG: GIY-YIG nuclease family protein [Pirellulales bacterium]|nr:GIY-YIG nuclease family protein [Pirellulales bacterium]